MGVSQVVDCGVGEDLFDPFLEGGASVLTQTLRLLFQGAAARPERVALRDRQRFEHAAGVGKPFFLCFFLAAYGIGADLFERAGDRFFERRRTIFERIAQLQNLLKRLTETEITGYCYWFECIGRQFGLHITPLTVADKFGEQMAKQKCAWIFTSATLEVGGTFAHFCQRLGIQQAAQKILPSPFNYAEQSLLCVPRYLPATNHSGTFTQLGKMLLPIIEANQGRCFVLCTSYAMMRSLADYFRESSELTILLQGETAKTTLLEQFISQSHSVLVATSSFWEGVDVRGDALSLVIIDKLPFTAPDEPLLKARIEDCRLQGGDPFNDIQIPEAVITLKQGVGRLIRDVTDRGAVIICDNRLVMRPYGETFLRSLPNFKRTRDLHKVVQFLTTLKTDDNNESI